MTDMPNDFARWIAGLLVLWATLSGNAWAQRTCLVNAYGGTSGTGFTLSPFTHTVNVATSANIVWEAADRAIGFYDSNGRLQEANPTSYRWVASHATTGSISFTFSQPIPANWIGVAFVDVGNAAPSSYADLVFEVSLSGAGNTATPSDFVMSALHEDGPAGPQDFLRLSYAPATGRIVKTDEQASVRESGVLRGNSAALVRQLTIQASGLLTGDLIGLHLLGIPSCVTTVKQSQHGVGSFSFAYTNQVTSANVPTLDQTLTTTTAGTPVASAARHARQIGAALGLTETVPTGWSMASASCSDANAAINGNPASFGNLSGGVLTVPAANVRIGSDIRCTFTNHRHGALTVAKSASPSPAVTGAVVTYTLTVSNPAGGPAVANALLRDAPGAGLDCAAAGMAAPTCTVLDGAAQCPASVTASALLSGGGVTLPSLPAGSSLAVTLQCRVMATGQ